jgi:flagellar basal-body rod protein FlgC
MSGLMDVMSIAASGLNAAQTQLAVTANNVANVNTPGYQAQRVDLVDLSPNGVGVGGITTDSSPVPADANGKPTGSNVDLAGQSVDLMREKTLYTANAAVIKTADQMLGTLLDMFDQDHDGKAVN